MVAEHIHWALAQQEQKKLTAIKVPNERLTARLIRSVEKGLPRDS
jgi:epoxyqueuosine reductase